MNEIYKKYEKYSLKLKELSEIDVDKCSIYIKNIMTKQNFYKYANNLYISIPTTDMETFLFRYCTSLFILIFSQVSLFNLPSEKISKNTSKNTPKNKLIDEYKNNNVLTQKACDIINKKQCTYNMIKQFNSILFLC